MKDYFFLSFFFCLYWICFLFKIDKIKKSMRHNLKLWSMGQKIIMHKLDLVKEWVMKSLPFWIKNLPQISHILYYYTVTYIIFKLNSNTFFNEYQTNEYTRYYPNSLEMHPSSTGRVWGWSLFLRVFLSEYSFIFWKSSFF